MSFRMMLVSLATLVLAACGSGGDTPTKEQVAKAYEQHMNANLATELGQHIEVRGWEDLTTGCETSGPERVTCVTGGTLDVVGFQGGAQLKPDAVPVPPVFDFTFEKRNGAWVAVSAQQKS